MLAWESCGELSEEGRAVVQRLERSARTMVERVTLFRALTRTGEHAVSVESVDLSSVVRSVTAEHDEALRARSVSVAVNDLGRVESCALMLRELYAKLLLDFLDATVDSHFVVEFTRDDRTATPVFGVRCTGRRRPDRALVTAFEAFDRTVERPTSRRFGLTTCRRIVELHSGNIWVEQDSDESCVHFPLGGSRA
jgi:light-regulated signal transduction histidine kinase (bacteriophytochrome)